MPRATPSGTDWSRRFEEPIALLGGASLVTLRDAATYIQQLPKRAHDQPHWQIAVEHLIYAAERGPGWLWLARIAMLQAINHGAPRAHPAPRRKAVKAVKAYRIVGSDAPS